MASAKKNKRQKEKRQRKADKKAEKAKKAEQRAAKKAAKQEEKEGSKSDRDDQTKTGRQTKMRGRRCWDQKKALTKLGLQKMPSKSSLNKLTCVQKKIKELLVNCAKDILSKTN